MNLKLCALFDIMDDFQGFYDGLPPERQAVFDEWLETESMDAFMLLFGEYMPDENDIIEEPRYTCAPYHRRIPTTEALTVRAKTSNNRARSMDAEGEHTAEDIKAQYRSQKGLCWWCGKPVYLDFQVDHRVPLSQGGSNDAGNLVISCADCNHKKNDKMPSEFNGRLL